MAHPITSLRWATAGRLALGFGAVVAFFIAFSTATGDVATQCTWDTSNGLDLGVRSLLGSFDSRRAGWWSHVFSIGIVPVISIGGVVVPALRSTRKRDAASNVVLVVLAFLLTTALADGVKKLATRQRPGFQFGRQDAIEASHLPLERCLSFFSGDTAWAFCFAASAVTIASMRGYSTTRPILVIGGVAAVAAGLLRIAADMHWATDVLAGATAGMLVGLALPFVFNGLRLGPPT